MKKIFIILFILFQTLLFSNSIPEECKVESTKISDPKAVNSLTGLHNLSLQWIESSYGKVKIEPKVDLYFLNGKQHNPKNDDLLILDGIITEIKSKSFLFCGKVSTKITHLNSGRECNRSGLFTFAIRGKRKYWRLQEMTNPCETGGVVDYIDIFFKIKQI